MTIAHHPGQESLMSCAAGSMPEAFAAVMASHISLCDVCRKELGLMEDIGVELFRSLQPSALTHQAPVMAMRRAQADAEGAWAAHATAALGITRGGMPRPIALYAGEDIHKVAWRRLAPGVQHFTIPLSPGAKGSLHLLKVAPGTVIPEHGHGGSELTLVLEGSYSDATGHYGVGDVADLDDTIEHQPLADPEEGCVCLVATDEKIRFKSPLARLLQPFTRL